MSTVSLPDTIAVIEDLLSRITEHLIDGKLVRLGEFGTYYANIKSDGAEKEGDFSKNLIQGLKLHFRPGKELANA